MIAIPLIQKIAELFLILFATAGLVKGGILKSEDSRILSRLSLYFVTPCVIFNSFQTKLTPDIQQGLLVAILVACVCQALYFLVAALMKEKDDDYAVRFATAVSAYKHTFLGDFNRVTVAEAEAVM